MTLYPNYDAQCSRMQDEEIAKLKAEVDRLTAELALYVQRNTSLIDSREEYMDIAEKLSNQLNQARAEAATLRETATDVLVEFRQRYNATDGVDRFFKYQERLDNTGTAATALHDELTRLREQRNADPMAYAVYCKVGDGDEFDYRIFAERAHAKDYVVEHFNEEDDDPDCQEIIELVPRLWARVGGQQ